ncbi:MAG: hypothetical protein BWY78_01173 [Alphaproteobacteria bacterium ADurb.Bin438]|nr:MAG: hypothetical protein BWY78_01173 [Alphaproteobacteria bacterium ADurb.Bin438]
MIEKVNIAYKDAISLAEETRTYIEGNLRVHSHESNNEALNTIKAMGRVTYLLTSIISFLLLSKAYQNGEVTKDKVIESSDALLPEILKKEKYSDISKDVKDIVKKLEGLSKKVKEIIIN